TSTTSRSISRPARVRLASAASPAVVTREPFSRGERRTSIRTAVSSSTTRRSAASSAGVFTLPSCSSSIRLRSLPFGGARPVHVWPSLRIDHGAEETFQRSAILDSSFPKCRIDTAGLWQGQSERQFPSLFCHIKLALSPVARSGNLDDVSRIDQLLQNASEALLGDAQHVEQF